MDVEKRLIEETFPIKEVSAESRREKNLRHGHISTLHIWWARRPLASSRATSYAALVSALGDKDFIVELSRWESSLNHLIIQQARSHIIAPSGGRPPKVLDPFSGGGSIPLEAYRLGCETHALEYNPVAVLILKCTLEYPARFGKAITEEVAQWSQRVLERSKGRLMGFYSSNAIGYIWSRTVPCQNPSCGAQIPLFRQFWLARKSNKRSEKKVALYPFTEGGEVRFKIVGTGYEEMPEGFDPSRGTVRGAVVTCPVCGLTIRAEDTRRLFREGKAGQRLVAVILKGGRGKSYRLAGPEDHELYRRAEEELERVREEFKTKWGFDPIPDEPLPPVGTLGFRVQRYGMTVWSDLFNSRQKLALVVFMDEIRNAYEEMLKEGYDPELAKAVVSYLGLKLGKLMDWNCSLCVWRPDNDRGEHLFNRQALPMVWDYFERNPFEGKLMNPQSMVAILSHLTQIPLVEHEDKRLIPVVLQGSATELPFPDDSFDAVFTDPPYYDNVPYSYLSDFFYVWLKRAIGDLHPDLFSTPLTPKSKEIVAYTHDRTWEEAKREFEEGLTQSLREINRVLKPGGIAVIVYTHKSTSGWETMIRSILESGFTITASWPIDTEMRGRLRAQSSAALASSIYFVARKVDKREIGWFEEIKREIREHLERKLEQLWEEEVVGADFFVAAIGSAVEIFGRYKRVMDYKGREIGVEGLLEFVRSAVTEYVVKQILHNGIAGELSPLTKFYILWRWNYKEAKVPFDDARKLGQSVGVDVAEEWGKKGFIKKEGEFVRVLGPHERKLEDVSPDYDLIDRLHYLVLLWTRGGARVVRNAIIQDRRLGSPQLRRVAQAIVETLPKGSKEKQLLEGLLVSIKDFRPPSELWDEREEGR